MQIVEIALVVFMGCASLTMLALFLMILKDMFR